MKSSGKFAALPAHIAIIMDGNGRWATARAMPRKMGHRAGVKTLFRIARHAFDLGIKYVTVFAFSTENRFRPKDEVDAMIELIRRNFDTAFSDLIANGIRVVVPGEHDFFPADVVESIEHVERESGSGTRGTLSVALNYGSRAEIVRAAETIAREGAAFTEQNFSAKLYTAGQPDPDMLIRTGGEKRLSNFLLWQASYSELFFTDTLWPDFTAKELDSMIEEYGTRTRRFGKV